MDLFEQITSFNNLWTAWIKAQYYSSTMAPYFDRSGYQYIEKYIDEVLLSVREQIQAETFVSSPLQIVRVPKGSESRLLYFQCPIDSIVTQAIINVIGPLFEASFSNSSYGHRLAIGDTESRETFEPWQQAYSTYVSKARTFVSQDFSSWYHITDVKDFYPSVNLDILLGQIALKVKDPRVLDLIRGILEMTFLNEKEVETTVRGLPPGTIYGHFFANVYLDVLDGRMSDMTSGYVRYVDDVTFVCDTEESLEVAIIAFQNELAKLGLRSNLTKTNSYPISQPNYLFEHTRKLKYDLRFGVIEELSAQEKQASRAFNDLFLLAERQDDIEKIAQESAAFVVNFLRTTDAETLETVALTLLETGITRASTLRAVLAAAMRCNLVNPSIRFLRFVEDSTNLEKLTFLQLLPYFENIDDVIIQLLFENWLKNDNYLVRASIFDALYGIGYHLQSETLVDFLEKEESAYVGTRIVQCLEFCEPTPSWMIFPNLLALPDLKIRTVLLYVIERLFEAGTFNRDDFSSLAPTLFTTVTAGDESLIRLLSLTISYGKSSDIQQAYLALRKAIREDVSSVIFPKVAASLGRASDYAALQQLNEALVNLNLLRSRDEALDQAIRVDDPKLDKDFQEQLRRYEQPRGSCPPIQEISDAFRGAYGNLSDYAGYVCRYYDCGNGLRGTVEIIDIDRLLGSTIFSSLADWWTYIEALEQDGIIDVYAKGSCPNDDKRIYCIYRIPEGFVSIQEWLSDRNTPPSEEDITGLMDLLVTILEGTQARGFLFQGINPWNTLYAQDKCKFLNIGYALRNPIYHCKSINCKWHLTSTAEIGPTTATYFLGLMLSEVLLLDCPVKAINFHQQNREKNYLRKMLQAPKLTPHFYSILGRLLASPSSRYSFLGPLEEDIEFLLKFQRSYHSLQSSLQLHEQDGFLKQYELFDYVQFRFQVANRNPRYADASMLGRTKHLITSLSYDVQYLDSSLAQFWKTASLPLPMHMFPKYLIVNWLSPESRHLLCLAAGWEELTRDVYSKLGEAPRAPISNILAIYALYEELCAVTHSTLMHSRFLKEIPSVEELKRLRDFSGGTEAMDENFQIVWTNTNGQQLLESPYNIRRLGEIVNIIKLFYEDASVHFSETDFAPSINTLTFLLFYEIYRPRITSEKSSDSSNTSILHIEQERSKTLSYPKIWALIQLPSELEQTLGELLSNSAKLFETDRNHWLNMGLVINELRNLSPSRRLSAELGNYQPIEQQGYLILKFFPYWFRHRDYGFRVPEVYASGTLTKERDKTRNIRVDSLAFENKRYICAVLSVPRYFSSITSTPNRFALIVHSFLREYHSKLRIGIPLLFSLLATLGLFINSTYDIRNIPSSLAFIILLFTSPLWSIAPDVLLKTLELVIKPEHTQDIRPR
ncbi:reverse transcriptase domain-containing protein [Aggregatilinea lenta]|uniref:reverse transcriptase domain-containing protein n=1 Tax=Aggregatilinea lenta TaxID=913108 RepID=UPI000E5BE7BB|nr:reverse transcriptase domain-containing protein [Aggregatilinea lenta]